jgi:hypothetical protein
MEILRVPKARKLAEAYHDGSITLREFMEELEWCWDMKIYRGTKTPVVVRKDVPMPPILTQAGQPKGT